MKNIDLKAIAVIGELSRTRSVSLAAEHLGLGQSAISMSLAKLRKHFGDPLFVRTSSGMEPTPYAQRIYPEVVASVDRLVKIFGTRASFDAANTRRQFRICMTDISEIVVLPTLVNHLRRVAPGVLIEAERISSDSARRLESGDIDLAVGFMPQLEAGFYQQTLFEQNFVGAAQGNHGFLHGVLHPLDDGGHADQTGHAQNDAQHGEQRAELVRPHFFQADEDGVQKIHSYLSA